MRYNKVLTYKSEDLYELQKVCYIICKDCHRLLGIQEIVIDENTHTEKDEQRILFDRIDTSDYGFQINRHMDRNCNLRGSKNHKNSTKWYEDNHVWFIPISILQ